MNFLFNLLKAVLRLRNKKNKTVAIEDLDITPERTDKQIITALRSGRVAEMSERQIGL